MTSRALTLPLLVSVLLHVTALASASRLVGFWGQAPPMELIPIQVVTAEPTSPAPLLQPKPERTTPLAAQKITPPRLIEKPLPPPAIQPSTESPPLAKELPPSLPSPSTTKEEEPRPGPVIPLPVTKLEAPPPPGNVIGPATTASSQAVSASGSAEGGEAGAGRHFANGDMAVLPGVGAGGGSGGPGTSGLGLGTTDAGPKVTGLQLGIARPRGGYQVTPRYPESARRAGIEGTALLKFLVQADGGVANVTIERSSGYADLDHAAVQAIKRWRFEPTRRDHRAVAAWAVLPVEFRLKRW
ncbi:MAG: energy transducer TonB [Candidatus Methylomirabilis oxyfera]|nr:energy transducer TonB [Candidatus Methylomirabilis oxyfera]